MVCRKHNERNKKIGGHGDVSGPVIKSPFDNKNCIKNKIFIQ